MALTLRSGLSLAGQVRVKAGASGMAAFSLIAMAGDFALATLPSR
jgi:hypothetical protein